MRSRRSLRYGVVLDLLAVKGWQTMTLRNAMMARLRTLLESMVQG